MKINFNFICLINLPENGIPIKSWFGDKSDNCLEELIPMFEKMR